MKARRTVGGTRVRRLLDRQAQWMGVPRVHGTHGLQAAYESARGKGKGHHERRNMAAFLKGVRQRIPSTP